MTVKMAGPEKEPIRFTRDKDKYGTVWTTRPTKYSDTRNVEIWAEQKKDKFWLRQEGVGVANVIVLDLGQAYDVIRALCEGIDGI